MIYRYPRPPILASIPRGPSRCLKPALGPENYTIEHLVVDRIIATDATLAQNHVVTFTEKATAELKTRIRALIERIIEDAEVAQQPPESHGEDNDWWYFDVGVKHKLEQELFSFDHAPIYTMHGFCHRLLTEMAFNSGQSFGQSQIDTDVIFERVWRDAVRHEFATDPECQETLIRWHKSSAGDGELMGLIRDAHKQGYLRNRLDIDTEVHSLRTRLRTHYNTTAYVEEVAQLAVQKRGLDAMALVGVELESALGMDVSPDEFLNVVSKLELKSLIKPPRSRVTETKRAYPDGLSEHQLNNRSDIHQLWRLVELLNTSERRDVDQLLTTLTKMLDARTELERLFEFDDLLNRVHDALTDPDNATLVTLLRERFRFGLIDEFQDTDDKQWDIFRRIFVGHPNGALYIIGDPKQAIYGFRGADIHTYLAARDSLLSNPDQPAARVPLNMNYRSTPAMINAVNTILDADGPHRLLSGPICYDEPVECGRPTLRLVDKSGNDIEPLTIWSRTVPPTGNRKSPSGASVMRAYLDDLVATIEQLLDPSEGYFIHEDGSSPKRLNGSDIFVLVRTGTEATLVTQTLRAAGITTARKSGQKIFQTHVCDDVIRLLTAISRPQQRSARMGLFYSAFIDIGPEQIAAFADETATESLMDIISGWRRLAERGDYGALWRRVAVETGLLVRELHNPKGEQFLTVAGQIFETIVEVFGHRGAPIEDVIEHLTRWRNGIDIPDGIETGLRLAADDNAVQVMTIHKSKGLQAGVVFLLGGFGRAPSKRIRTVNHAGQRHVVVGKGACEAFKDLLNAQAAEEDERLLYVGLTERSQKCIW